MWTGINGNRVDCAGVDCNEVTVWWYDRVTPFRSGDVPDKLVSAFKGVRNMIYGAWTDTPIRFAKSIIFSSQSILNVF